jgi:GntR family transcriptional repressor for pyruvate dehydrogenase complex
MKPIERVPVVLQVVANLQELIDRSLQPGDKVPTEKELIEMFGVGRSTVREALRMLQAKGVVEFLQGKGAFVAEKNEDPQVSAKNWFKELGAKVADFMEMRIAVEPISARLAIQRASAGEVAKIAEAHNLYIQSIEAADPLKLASYDESFHMEIARATHNELFINIQIAIKECFFETRVKSFTIKERVTGAVIPHQKILDAFYIKDAEAGYQAMLEHLTQAFKDVIKTQDK